MRIRALLLVPVLVIGITACGGGDDAASTTTRPGTKAGGDTAAASTTAPDSGGGDSSSATGSGDVDCPALQEAGGKMTIQLQLLAQMNSPAQVEAVTQSPVVPLDLDGLNTALETLHQLDRYDEPPFGSPKESIADLQKATNDAQALIASTPDAAAVDAFYRSDIVSPTEFLMKQSAISAALDAAC